MDNASCGCKGIRSCALCRDTDRVKALLRNVQMDYSLYDTGVLCHICGNVLPLAVKRPYSLKEVFDISDACKHEFYDEAQANFSHPSLDGLVYVEDFVTEEEETDLVRKIDADPWLPSQSGRRKQDFSPRVNFKKQKVKLDRFTGLPDYSVPLLKAMAQVDGLKDYQILELCNLEYDNARGSTIEFHIDDVWIWGDRLISINLLAGSVMSMLNEESRVLVYVPMRRRSLLCMKGYIRYNWKHAILPEHIESRRIALTMREPEKKFLPGGSLFDTYGREMLERSKIVINIHSE